MAKTLTIRDDIYRKLVSIKGKDESFSQLLERLMGRYVPSEILKSLKGKIELDGGQKKRLLSELNQQREERRG